MHCDRCGKNIVMEALSAYGSIAANILRAESEQIGARGKCESPAASFRMLPMTRQVRPDARS
eukprot:scaffold72937_cov38-Tisochrysis_lutea.AAC.5